MSTFDSTKTQLGKLPAQVGDVMPDDGHDNDDGDVEAVA